MQTGIQDAKNLMGVFDALGSAQDNGPVDGYGCLVNYVQYAL